MNSARINERLEPFLSASLTRAQVERISIYIDLLLRWNSRVNLTAIRDPEQIVTRHFGESLFAARHLVPNPAVDPATGTIANGRFIDLGSGAGFPGVPFKIWAPESPMTLIESNHKKVAFLREVIRALTLTSIDVFSGRAEDFPAGSGASVTLRAVERFTAVLPAAARLLAPNGRLALLIGNSQVGPAKVALPTLRWAEPLPIPGSSSRVVLVGTMT